MEKETRPITWSEVKEAEEIRFKGNWQSAIEKIKPARINPKNIPSLSKKDLITHLAAWRIDADANTAASKRTLSGKKAIESLKEAKIVFDNYYNHPEVEAKAPQIKKDLEGNPYEFAVEMLRDKGRYSLALFRLTGNVVFELDALDSFDKAIEIAEEITGKGLAKMEAGIIRNDYKQIKEGHHEVYPEAIKRGNTDRARWSSKIWLFESLKRGKLKEARKAWQESILANKGLKETFRYFGKNEIPKFAVGAALHFIRKLTLPRNIDFEELRIKI